MLKQPSISSADFSATAASRTQAESTGLVSRLLNSYREAEYPGLRTVRKIWKSSNAGTQAQPSESVNPRKEDIAECVKAFLAEVGFRYDRQVVQDFSSSLSKADFFFEFPNLIMGLTEQQVSLDTKDRNEHEIFLAARKDLKDFIDEIKSLPFSKAMKEEVAQLIDKVEGRQCNTYQDVNESQTILEKSFSQEITSFVKLEEISGMHVRFPEDKFVCAFSGYAKGFTKIMDMPIAERLQIFSRDEKRGRSFLKVMSRFEVIRGECPENEEVYSEWVGDVEKAVQTACSHYLGSVDNREPDPPCTLEFFYGVIENIIERIKDKPKMTKSIFRLLSSNPSDNFVGLVNAALDDAKENLFVSEEQALFPSL